MARERTVVVMAHSLVAKLRATLYDLRVLLYTQISCGITVCLIDIYSMYDLRVILYTKISCGNHRKYHIENAGNIIWKTRRISGGGRSMLYRHLLIDIRYVYTYNIYIYI